MKILIGTSGYSYNEWKGKFYPEKISGADMMAFYSKRLETVEINNTFYRMPTPHVVASWAEQVPAGFVFAIKAPQIITHIKRLKDVKEETRFFLKTVAGLGKKLGCALFQFPGSFREDPALLGNFLGLIPEKTPCAFDFRSASWMNPRTLELLRQKKFCLCQEDTDENPVEEIASAASWGYLRMRRADYSDADLSQWSKKLSSMNWKKTFVFFKHEDDIGARGPELALRFRELMRDAAV